MEEEVRDSFAAYEALWQARARELASVSLILSRMSDVRAAFNTADPATIADTAGEIWNKIARPGAIFLVTDPRGAVLAGLGAFERTPRVVNIVRLAAVRFPEQASGFLFQDGALYQTVLTPVYVASSRGPALLDVLVAGIRVDAELAEQLKQTTGGSEFVFLVGGRVVTSTLAHVDAHALSTGPAHVTLNGLEYSRFSTALGDIQGVALGQLHVLRSFEAARQRISSLRRNMIAAFVLAMLAGLLLTYTLARRILEPVRALDRAAAAIARGDYQARVTEHGRDELGRLARTFNSMCASISAARDELIRRERISTIGRLSTSIVHDLRNPLAAIYGGAELLVDEELPPPHVQRLARNIYRASRRVQELLTDLTDVTRGRTHSAEPCRLREVVEAARDVLLASAESHHVEIGIEIDPALELMLERSRIERVFENLFVNSMEAMPDGGLIRVTAERNAGAALVRVCDSGPGIAPELLPRLFEPFSSLGKKNGMGLGLALSRQTLLDHAGNLTLDSVPGPAPRSCCASRSERLFTASSHAHNDIAATSAVVWPHDQENSYRNGRRLTLLPRHPGARLAAAGESTARCRANSRSPSERACRRGRFATPRLLRLSFERNPLALVQPRPAGIIPHCQGCGSSTRGAELL